jgi:hypothetical protein
LGGGFDYIKKKVETKDTMDKTNFFLLHPTLQALGSFSHIVACGSSSNNMGKMSLITVFNKKSP